MELKRIEFDRRTKAWFDSHIGFESTIVQCPICKLFYKPSLGHKCKKETE